MGPDGPPPLTAPISRTGGTRLRTDTTPLRWAGFALLLVAASPAWSQVAINHSNALAGGVTPGDTAGYPVKLTLSGSYQLTSNLTVPDANTSAILITADYVTVDLNGVAIRGPTVCTGTTVSSCTPTGTGVGGYAASRKGIVVSNGQVVGMGSRGILVGPRSRVERVIVQSNGDHGIFAGSDSLVTGCQASGNRLTGIVTVGDGTVSNNTADGNGGSGIQALGTVTNNTTHRNGLDGINAQGTVLNNEASGNTHYGLDLSIDSGYAHNVLNTNNGGNTHPQVAGGFEIGGNVCGGDTICP